MAKQAQQEKMTIHRALAELKLIDSKINKKIELIEPSGWMQKDQPVNGFYEKKRFEENAKSAIQSIQDLISRKQRIKSAIVKVNSETKVKIGEMEMTIADAINFRSIIELKRALVAMLHQKHIAVKKKIEQNNPNITDNALALAMKALGKDNVKIDDKDAIAITKPYIENYKFRLVDPLVVEDLIERLQTEIDEYETYIDATLSEINATTMIEI